MRLIQGAINIIGEILIKLLHLLRSEMQKRALNVTSDTAINTCLLGKRHKMSSILNKKLKKNMASGRRCEAFTRRMTWKSKQKAATKTISACILLRKSSVDPMVIGAGELQSSCVGKTANSGSC